MHSLAPVEIMDSKSMSGLEYSRLTRIRANAFEFISTERMRAEISYVLKLLAASLQYINAATSSTIYEPMHSYA